MPRETLKSEYSATFTSFSGADIKATFANRVIGELQAISYSVTREKAPQYTMGEANPRSFARGKRGIAGSFVLTVFNNDPLSPLKDNSMYTTDAGSFEERFNPDLWEKDNEDASVEGGSFILNTNPTYADQIPPFDITITMVNEYGQGAKFEILGVEILNEGAGMSVDDITTERAFTFVARKITPIETIAASDIRDEDGNSNVSF